MSARFLIIGLDGFDPDLASRWMDSGDLPHLRHIREIGICSRLRSTTPPFTYPAWSTFLTGTNPGKHGIIDFAMRKPNSYDLGFINATYRAVPTIFRILSEQGKKVMAMGFPTTYPPEPVRGIMISGFDSPVAVNADASFCYPPSLYDELKTKVAPYTLAGIQELRITTGWHDQARRTIVETARKRLEIATYLLEKDDWDLAACVFSESDTISHHFWSFHDPLSPRRIPGDDRHRDAILEVYRTLDQAVGQLHVEMGDGAHLMIVSDHGFGGTGARSLSINRLLHRSGFFQFKPRSWIQSNWTGMMRKSVQWLPVGFQEWCFRSGGAAIPSRMESASRIAAANLARCTAFSDELNYFPSVWLHDQRFPMGTHRSGSERDRLLDEISEALLSYRDPVSGQAVLSRVFRREDIYHGSELARIPDLILELNLDGGYAYPVVRMTASGEPIEPLPPEEWLGRKGGSMNGSHRQYGIFMACGPGITKQPAINDLDIADLAPTCLALSGIPIPEYMDGQVIGELVGNQPVCQSKRQPSIPESVAPHPYSQNENDTIQQRLEDLGYL